MGPDFLCNKGPAMSPNLFFVGNWWPLRGASWRAQVEFAWFGLTGVWIRCCCQTVGGPAAWGHSVGVSSNPCARLARVPENLRHVPFTTATFTLPEPGPNWCRRVAFELFEMAWNFVLLYVHGW